MVSEESSSESSEIHNSATEISTDSEFAQDEPTPTRELPSIALNDFYVTKTRGSGKANCPKRLQVTSGFIQRHQNEKSKPQPDIELNDNDDPKTPNFPIPRVEVHAAKESDKEEMALDSLTEQQRRPTAAESSKSITSEKKSLNQPKTLPNLESVLPDIHKALHVKLKLDKEDSAEENRSQKTVSGKSSPDLTAALTETELSDWARDETVSDSIELDISHQSCDRKRPIKMAQLSEFDEAVNQHVCGKGLEALHSRNLDGIEYMDTATETSSEDGVVDSQNGYVLLKSEDELAEDSLNPKDIFEARNVYLSKRENTGYCELVKGNSFGGEVVDLKAADVEQLRQKQLLTDHEEDSLLVAAIQSGVRQRPRFDRHSKVAQKKQGFASEARSDPGGEGTEQPAQGDHLAVGPADATRCALQEGEHQKGAGREQEADRGNGDE
ncbi:hypothetical protein D910_01673 [Dendroctonus ponderosae]|uniref:Uncharacterized protein n=1 Tax=Dendroctonus ponderosae TaxID=77166 RepID=U4TWD1_DENPD|nr:hypothetical protein D910_01673 [Dendroctonus ponderosae]